jgi:hypothetical protein
MFDLEYEDGVRLTQKDIDGVLATARRLAASTGLFRDVQGTDQVTLKALRDELSGYDDSTSDYSYQAARDILKQETVSEESEDFEDFVFTVADEFEANIRYDLDSVMPTLLLRHPGFEPWEVGSDSSDEHYEDFKSSDVYEFAKGYIDETHLRELSDHNYQSGGGIGVYVLAEDYKFENGVMATGKVVVASHNSYQGDADYATSSKDVSVSFASLKDLVDSADVGEYSIGGVFGTKEWVWK